MRYAFAGILLMASAQCGWAETKKSDVQVMTGQAIEVFNLIYFKKFCGFDTNSERLSAYLKSKKLTGPVTLMIDKGSVFELEILEKTFSMGISKKEICLGLISQFGKTGSIATGLIEGNPDGR